MNPPTPVSKLKLLGGHPALDFVNTIGDWNHGVRDSFAAGGDVLDWAKRSSIIDDVEARSLQRLLDAEPDAAARLLREARKLRLVVHDVFSAIAAQRTPPTERFDTLAAAAERAQNRRKLVSKHDSITWEWTHTDDPTTILDRIAHAAAELAVNAQDVAIKECPGHSCGWLFIDTSRNGKRRWCAEADCGTRERVRAYRERKADGG